MVSITYFGHSAFKIRGKKTTVVTDPYDKATFGRLMPKVDAEVVTISHHHHDHDALERVMNSPFVIDQPGEYEIKGAFILGIDSFHDQEQGAKRGRNTIYLIEMDGVKIGHLGDLGQKLSERQIEQINGVDVLMAPVGGIYTLEVKKMVETINQIDPKIIVPMHYRQKDSLIKLGRLEKFLEESGEKSSQKQEVLKINKDQLPEEREVIVLYARS